MVTDNRSELSSLLALRDGEPLDAQALPEAGPERDAKLAELVALRQGLRTLPDVPIDESVWRSLETTPATDTAALPAWQRFPLATAASVLLLSALTVFGALSPWQNEAPDSTPTYANLVMPNVDHRMELMDRSRRLEQVAADAGAWRGQENGLQVSPVGELVLFKLARVDAEIARVQEQGLAVDDALWARRIELLQTFVAELQSQNPERFGLGRSL